MPATRRRTRYKTSHPTKPDVPPVSKTIQPGTDFYKFVNGTWLRHVNMPPYLSSYGVSEEIEDEINKELMAILLESQEKVVTKPDHVLPHTVYLLGALTESALNIKSQDLNIKTLKKLVSSLRCIRDTNELASTIGDFMKYRIKCIFSSIVVPPESNNRYLRFALMPGDLGLPDPAYYEDIESRTIGAYSRLLKKLSDDFEIQGLETIVGFEREMAVGLLKSRGDREEVLTGHELMVKYTHIPWLPLFHSLLHASKSEFESMKILIPSLHWLSSVNSWFKSVSIEQWKLLLSAHMMLHFLPFLPPPYDDLEFELYGHRMRGQSKKTPQQRLALRVAQTLLTGSLGDMFVRRHVPSRIKTVATDLANEIRLTAIRRVGEVDWLDLKTRHVAQKKLKNMEFGIAYPTVIQKDRKTNLNPENLVENILKLSHLDFLDETEKINTVMNRKTWDEAVFAVNAYYYNESNHLILPAGILRWPFFDVHASDGWNFGGIGATIAHEICHGFDNDGKEFDETGNRRPWWDKTELRAYNKKTKDIIELYNKTTYFGHHLNGTLTLSENIADLGGVAIALEALKDRMKKRGASEEEKKRQIRDFFISYAVSWRVKDRKEKAVQSLFMDSHAPAPARVNNIVSQFDDWYEYFDIKPGQVLYKPSNERIRIF
jgi:putative endopeptidase